MEDQQNNIDESELEKEIEFDDENDSQKSDSDFGFNYSSSSDDFDPDLSSQINIRLKQEIKQNQSDHDILNSSLDLINKSFSIPPKPEKTVEEIEKEKEIMKKTNEFIKLSMKPKPELDLDDIFGPKIVIPPSSIKVKRMFMTKGFVSARNYQQIEQKEDFNNAEDEDVMNEVVNAEFLGTSAEFLTQSVLKTAEKVELSSSSHKSVHNSKNEKEIEGMESFENINEDFTEEYVEPDDDEIKCTEDFETSFMNISNLERSRSPFKFENDFKFVKDTEDLESSFIHQNQFTESLPTSKPPKFSGFSLASGKSVEVKNLKNIENKFKESDQDIMREFNVIEDQENLQMPKFSGFSFASGKSVEVKNLKKIENVFKKHDESIANEISETKKPENVETSKFCGFSFASGKSVKIQNNTNLKEAEDLFQIENEKIELELNLESSRNENAPKMSGFSFASGKSVKLSDKKIKNQINLFNKEDSAIVRNIDQDFSFKTPVTAKEFATSRLKSSGKSTPTSTLNCDDKDLNDFSSARKRYRSTSKKSLFRNELNSEKNQKNEKNDHEPRFFDDVVNTPPLKRPRLLFENVQNTASPSLQMELFRKGLGNAQHSTPNVPKRMDNNENFELGVNSLLNDSSVTIGNFNQSPKRDKLTKQKLEDKFDSLDLNNSLDEKTLEEIIKIENSASCLVPIELKLQRKQALDDQQLEINDKCDFDRKPMAGSVFMKKSSSQRMKMKDFVGNSPMKLSRHVITFDNAIDYKFKAQNYPELDSIETYIILADNAKLIPDEFNQFGINEFSSAFLSSPGVDPKLVKDGWIQNAYKLLVLKFSYLENSFEKFEKFELLTPENILLHLKYRYDREIDRFHCSCLKKIVQLDDVACKRMILKIMDIKSNSKDDPELILSDGWYSIQATLDKRLQKAVETQKIQIGRKLIISCADLIGCEKGFDPLELPSNVRLKIHANSTRITGFHEKLGFCRCPYPIKISLDSIEELGGTVGCVRVFVTHVYSVLYSKKEDESKEFINQKTFERIQKEREIQSSFLYDTISLQVQMEEQKRIRESIESGKLKKKSYKELTPDEVYDLLKLSNDFDYITEITSKISNETKRKLENIKQTRKEIMEDEIRQRIGEQTQKFSRVLRFRVVDAKNPNKTALVSWWSATDELVDSIKVGKLFEISQLNAANFRDEIQLIANSTTILKSFKDSEHQDYTKFMRKLTRIDEIDNNFNPPNCEFDIICVVIKIEDEDKNSNIQKVLVSDENCNFIYINFWWNLERYAFDNVISEGKIFYVRNLQWRKNHKQNLRFKQVFMKIETNFITSPKDKEITQKLESLRTTIVDPSNFALKCCMELENGKENFDRKSITDELNEETPDKSKLSKTLSDNSVTNPSRKRLIGVNTSSRNLRSSTSQKRMGNEHHTMTHSKKRKK